MVTGSQGLAMMLEQAGATKAHREGSRPVPAASSRPEAHLWLASGIVPVEGHAAPGRQLPCQLCIALPELKVFRTVVEDDIAG